MFSEPFIYMINEEDRVWVGGGPPFLPMKAASVAREAENYPGIK